MGERMHEIFARMSAAANRFSGAPGGFAVALCVIAVWALCGPIFHFSDTWQLVINTGTTIVTFLLAFLINGTQTVAQDRMEMLEQLIDEHVRTTAKQHTEELQANTALTRQIHALVVQWAAAQEEAEGVKGGDDNAAGVSPQKPTRRRAKRGRAA